MPITRNPTTIDVQALISQLQEDKHFGKIGTKWSVKIKAKEIYAIERIGNAILRFKINKDNISSNRATLAVEKVKSDDCVSLLKMIIHMKVKEAIE